MRRRCCARRRAHRPAGARRRHRAPASDGTAPGSALVCPAAMALEERFVPRFAAEPPQEDLPYGRWEQRLSEELLAGVAQLDAEAAELGEPGEVPRYPDRPWHGRRELAGDA